MEGWCGVLLVVSTTAEAGLRLSLGRPADPLHMTLQFLACIKVLMEGVFGVLLDG